MTGAELLEMVEREVPLPWRSAPMLPGKRRVISWRGRGTTGEWRIRVWDRGEAVQIRWVFTYDGRLTVMTFVALTESAEDLRAYVRALRDAAGLGGEA